MIKLSASAIVCAKEDGSACAFDFDRMRKLVSEACVKCGISDKNIGDDIAFSIEFALRTLAEQGREFTEREIDIHIVKILENAGFFSLSKEYIKLANAEVFMPASSEAILPIITNSLSISETEAAMLAAKVAESLSSLSLSKTTPGLVVELSKFMMMADDIPEPKNFPKDNPLSEFSTHPWFICQDDILPSLSNETLSFMASGALSLLPVSKLFPSLKIELNLARFAELRRLEKPFTEMLLALELPSLSTPMLELDAATRKLYEIRKNQITPRISGNETLPAYLTLSDMRSFCSSCLQLDLDDGIKTLRELFESCIVLPPGLSVPELEYSRKKKLDNQSCF